LEQDAHLGPAYRASLERIIDADNLDLKLAYQSMLKKYDDELICKYLEKVCDCYIDLEMYTPIRKKEYSDWLRKISKNSSDLAELVSHPPSADLNPPVWLGNMDGLLHVILENYGDGIAKEQFIKSDPHLKRILQKMPVTILLDALAKLADDASSMRPEFYWEKDLGITAPTKHGTNRTIAQEQIVVKAIKRLTLATFGKPHHDFVALLANTLLGMNDFSADSVSKVPMN